MRGPYPGELRVRAIRFVEEGALGLGTAVLCRPGELQRMQLAQRAKQLAVPDRAPLMAPESVRQTREQRLPLQAGERGNRFQDPPPAAAGFGRIGPLRRVRRS
jgi:hypothetical protein